jgi:hypothetical protein
MVVGFVKEKGSWTDQWTANVHEYQNQCAEGNSKKPEETHHNQIAGSWLFIHLFVATSRPSRRGK